MAIQTSEKYMLVYAIALRYWELHGVAKTDSKDMLQRIHKVTTPKESLVDVNNTYDNIKYLHQILSRFLVETMAPNYSATVQALKVSIKEDKELYETVRDAIDHKKTPEEVESMCIAYQRYIEQFFRKLDFVQELKKETSSILYGNEEFNLTEVARRISELSAGYSLDLNPEGRVGIKSPIVIGGFSTDEFESVHNAWALTQENINPDAVMRTGYQGLNEALGGHGLFRGDTVVVGALQHKYKSGMINDLTADLPHYNRPYFFTDAKKAAIVKISFENHIADDLMRLYKRIHVHKYGTLPSEEDVLQISPERVAEEIEEHVGANGFKLIHVRINPSDVGYLDIINFLKDIIRMGYEIHVCLIDYLITMSTKGIAMKRDGTEYQEMYRLMRNFCSEHNITFITPHQLSVDATYLNRDDIGADFVNQVAGNSYYAKSKQIDREVDVEIVQHLYDKKNPTGGKTTYLTMKVGKNRRIHDTPDEKKSFAMPFTEMGLIADVDKDKPNYIRISTLKKAGAATEEEMSW